MTNIFRRNNITISGEGQQVILFAHGFGCDQKAWNYIKDDFLKDHKVVLFDYVGAGNSDLSAYDSEKYNSLNGYAKDVVEICKAIEAKDVVFVGHSVSSMIGALASISQPDLFKKLIFIGPSPCYINKEEYVGGFDRETIESLFEVMEEDYIGWAQSLAPAIMNKNNGGELGQELTDNFCAIDPEIAKDFAKATFLGDNRKDLPFIPVESLTIQCAEDMIAPMEVGQYILANTPKNTMIILNMHGHCPHMSHPEETIAAIRSYL